MRVRKDSRIHSFGHLDVDVWTLRRFRKSKEENNINSLHFLFLPYFPTKKKNIGLTSNRPMSKRPFLHLQKTTKTFGIFLLILYFCMSKTCEAAHARPLIQASWFSLNRSIAGKYITSPRLWKMKFIPCQKKTSS